MLQFNFFSGPLGSPIPEEKDIFFISGIIFEYTKGSIELDLLGIIMFSWRCLLFSEGGKSLNLRISDTHNF